METTFALEVFAKLVCKVVFARILINEQLFLCPVPFGSFPERKLIATAVPKVNEKPQHNPARPGNPSNTMGEHDERENAADAQEPEHTSYGQQARLAVFASKSNVERHLERAGSPGVFEAQHEQRNEHQHISRCSTKGIHIG